MRTFLIRNATIVNEGRQFVGSVLVEGERIARIFEGRTSEADAIALAGVETIEAEGKYLLPGVIDEHVHFREPGLTHKADIASESQAAAAGGVTTYFDMPNCKPQTTDLEAWEQKMRRAEECSLVNYAFYIGATNDNAPLLAHLDTHAIPAVKLFMGSSTGGMLVDREDALRKVFASSPLPIVAHCEDTAIINRNIRELQSIYGADLPLRLHPRIRSTEACLASSLLAARLAKESGARLLIAHVTTAEELRALHERYPAVALEACMPHLLFTDADYDAPNLGTRIKCNPAVKTREDREALREALVNGIVTTVATDHAPHLLEEKQGNALTAASGMPMVQFSLIAMLGLLEEMAETLTLCAPSSDLEASSSALKASSLTLEASSLTLPRIAELMSHAPARYFGLSRRGYLREGYQADLVLVERTAPWTLTRQHILSRCAWSPLEGRHFTWRVARTFCNGHCVYDGTTPLSTSHGQASEFFTSYV